MRLPSRIGSISAAGALVLALSAPAGAALLKVEAGLPSLSGEEKPSSENVEVPSVSTPGVPSLPEAKVSVPPSGEPTTPPPPTGSLPPPVGEASSPTGTASGPSASGSSSPDPTSHSAQIGNASNASSANAIPGSASSSRTSLRQPSRYPVAGHHAASHRSTHTRGPAKTRGIAPSLTLTAQNAARRSKQGQLVNRSGGPASNPLDSIGRHIPLPLPVPDWSRPIILVLLLLVIWFAVRSRLTLFRARGLERQRASLLRDMQAMQVALVPDVPAQIGGVRASVAYHPAEGPAAGGDFYDLFATGPNKVAVILGDVAGHGRDALSHAALTRYTLRAYLQAGLEPRAAIALAGQALVDPSSLHYATVVVGAYDTSTGRLTCASAGHPPPILLGAGDEALSSICSCPPIGWGIPTGRRQTTISLGHNAHVCFFSDGLVEARADGTLLGRDRLSDLIGQLGPQPTAAALLERVSATADTTRDDMAACILSPLDGGCGASVHEEEIEVDARMIGGPQLPRLLSYCGIPSDDIARSLAIADGIAASLGAAVLRVVMTSSGSTIAVDPPAPEPELMSPGPPVQPVTPTGRPSLRVFQGGGEPGSAPSF